MTIFFSLLINLLPLYGLIGLGYFAGRFLKVDRESLGALALYIFVPFVIFGFVSDLDFKPAYLILPIAVYIIHTIVALIYLNLGKTVYGDHRANLMAMCASMGNAGYFGLPLVLLLFEKEIVAIYAFMLLGNPVFEATIGYYIAARGNFTVKESLIKLIKFPTIYAMAAGFLVNATGTELPELFWTYWTHFKGAYVIIGMMIVGVALSKNKKLVLGPRFLALVFSGKFILWPILAYLFIWLDTAYLHWISSHQIYLLIMVQAIVPPAANIATFATQMNLAPEKAATTILLGTIFALFYIPAIMWLLGM